MGAKGSCMINCNDLRGSAMKVLGSVSLSEARKILSYLVYLEDLRLNPAERENTPRALHEFVLPELQKLSLRKAHRVSG